MKYQWAICASISSGTNFLCQRLQLGNNLQVIVESQVQDLYNLPEDENKESIGDDEPYP